MPASIVSVLIAKPFDGKSVNWEKSKNCVWVKLPTLGTTHTQPLFGTSEGRFICELGDEVNDGLEGELGVGSERQVPNADWQPAPQ